MQSYRCGKDVKYRFCPGDCNLSSGADDLGAYERFYGGAGTVSNSDVAEMKQEVSTVILQPYHTQVKNGVTLFSEPDCTGVSSVFFAGSSVSMVPSDVKLEGFDQLKVTSMMVPPGYAVIHNGINFTGPEFKDSMETKDCVNADKTIDVGDGEGLLSKIFEGLASFLSSNIMLILYFLTCLIAGLFYFLKWLRKSTSQVGQSSP